MSRITSVQKGRACEFVWLSGCGRGKQSGRSICLERELESTYSNPDVRLWYCIVSFNGIDVSSLGAYRTSLIQERLLELVLLNINIDNALLADDNRQAVARPTIWSNVRVVGG